MHATFPNKIITSRANIKTIYLIKFIIKFSEHFAAFQFHEFLKTMDDKSIEFRDAAARGDFTKVMHFIDFVGEYIFDFKYF